MATTWEKVANWLTWIGLGLFAAASMALVFGTGIVSLIGGMICGLLNCTLEDIEIMEEEGL